MKIKRTGDGQENTDEQAWELINDLALYETWKPFLDPLSHDAVPTRSGEAENTYRAVIITLESGRAPRCRDRVGKLIPCEDANDRLIEWHERDQGSTRRAVARALAPVTRVLQRVRQGGEHGRPES